MRQEHRGRGQGLSPAPFLHCRARLLHRVDEARLVCATCSRVRPDAGVDAAALLLHVAVLNILGVQLDLSVARCAFVLSGPAAAHPHTAAAQVLQLPVQLLAAGHELDPALSEHRQVEQAQRLQDQDQERCERRLDGQLLAEKYLGELVLDVQRVVAVRVGEYHGSEAHRQRRRRPEREEDADNLEGRREHVHTFDDGRDGENEVGEEGEEEGEEEDPLDAAGRVLGVLPRANEERDKRDHDRRKHEEEQHSGPACERRGRERAADGDRKREDRDEPRVVPRHRREKVLGWRDAHEDLELFDRVLLLVDHLACDVGDHGVERQHGGEQHDPFDLRHQQVELRRREARRNRRARPSFADTTGTRAHALVQERTVHQGHHPLDRRQRGPIRAQQVVHVEGRRVDRVPRARSLHGSVRRAQLEDSHEAIRRRRRAGDAPDRWVRVAVRLVGRAAHRAVLD
eukprot:817748-Rhodomonas_salina.2